MMLPPHEVLKQFLDRTLPFAQWTHEAHLSVCHQVLATVGTDEAIDVLRPAIRMYNDHVGTPNTASSGYHETLTRYYVGAVAHVAGDLDAVLVAAETSRQAPLRYWTRDRLFSPKARQIWLGPDLEPLPWRGATVGE